MDNLALKRARAAYKEACQASLVRVYGTLIGELGGGLYRMRQTQFEETMDGIAIVMRNIIDLDPVQTPACHARMNAGFQAFLMRALEKPKRKRRDSRTGRPAADAVGLRRENTGGRNE